MPPQKSKRLPTDFFDRLLSNQTDDQINDLLNSLVDEQISPSAEPAEDLMPLMRTAPAPVAPPKRSNRRDKFEDAIVTRDEELDELPSPSSQDGLDELIPKTSRMQTTSGETKTKSPAPQRLGNEDIAALEAMLSTSPQDTKTPAAKSAPAIPIPSDLPGMDLSTLGVATPETSAFEEWPTPPLPPEPPLPEIPQTPEETPQQVSPKISAPAPLAIPVTASAPPAVTLVRRVTLPVDSRVVSHEELIRRRAAARWEHPKRKPKLPKLAKPVAPISFKPWKQDAVDQYLNKQKREKRSLGISKIQRAGLMFLLPGFIAFSLFSWYPMLKGLMLSFFNYHPTGVSTFIGFQNYERAFHDTMFWRTLMHAGGFCALALVLGFWLPILLAIFINELKSGKRFLKFAYFLPFLMPMVPAAILWKWMMDQGFGLFNAVLSVLGVSQPHVGWLTNPKLALLSIVMLYLWKNTGWAVLIYSAGLANIDETFYEQAELEGATLWNKVMKITLPSLRTVIGVMLIITIINTLQLFTEVYIMTNGGPMSATEMITTYIYKQAFFHMDIGYASALSMLLLLMLLIITMFRLRRLEPEGA